MWHGATKEVRTRNSLQDKFGYHYFPYVFIYVNMGSENERNEKYHLS